MTDKPTRTGASWLVYLLGALAAGAIVAAVLVVGPASGSQTSVTRTAKAAQGVVQSTVSGSGNLAAASQLNLGFKTSGTVTHIYVTQGQQVVQGQLLATLDPQSAEVTLEQSKAALQSAEANLAKEEETDGETATGSSTGAGSGGSSSAGDSSASGASASAAAVPAASDASAREGTIADVAYTAAATPAYTAPSTQPTAPTDGGATTAPSTTSPSTTTTAPATTTPGTTTPATTPTSTTPATTPTSKSPSTTTTSKSPSKKKTTTTTSERSTSGGEREAKESKSSSSVTPTISTATREANLASARAAVKSDRLTVQSDEQAVQDTRMYAPEDGTIVSLAGQVGEVVSGSGTTKASSSSSSSGSGSSTGTGAAAAGGAGSSNSSKSSASSSSSSSAFAVLSDLSSMQLVVPLSESEIGNVRAGQPATVTVEALSAAKLAAHVSEVALLSTSSSGAVSYDVTFQLDQMESGLKVGMSATAEVVVKQAEGVNVPTSAISAGSVTVEHNGKQERRRVVTGLAGNTSTIILSGLRAGETVVLPAASTTSSSTSLTSRLGRAGGGLGAAGGLTGGGGGFAGGGGPAFFRGGG